MVKGFSTLLKRHGWLGLVLVLVILLRTPSLFEPYWYGDEGIYLTIGRAINNGAELYKDIHDNKPPFIYLVAALAGGSQFWYRFIAMGFNLLTVIAFYFLATEIIKEKKIALGATAIFGLLSSIPLFEGNVANAENFFILFTILSAGMLIKSRGRLGMIFVAGVILGLGGLFKIPAVFEAIVWPIWWWTFKDKGWFVKSVVLAIGVLIPLIISGVYFVAMGVGSNYLIAAGIQNVPYLSTWKAGVESGIFTLKGRALMWFVGVSVMWGLSQRLGRVGFLIGMWGLSSIFAALLSGRPYPHYLLQVTPVIALAIGMIVKGDRFEKLMSSLICILVVIVFGVFHFYHYATWGYYSNYAKWVTKAQSKSDYYLYFGNEVETNYEVSQFVRSGSTRADKLFVWGDQPVIYTLAERKPATRYIVKYHINDFKAEKETIDTLSRELPKYIVTYADPKQLPGLNEILDWRYKKEITINHIDIYRRFELVMAKSSLKE